MSNKFDFTALADAIKQIHQELAAQASRAVNVSLTLRNWMIGFHLAEYELSGSDRAAYGEKLLELLAKDLTGSGVSNCSRRQLYRYLHFYKVYPHIGALVSEQFKKLLPDREEFREKVGTVSPQLRVSPDKLVEKLSYSHLELIVSLDEELKRIFYETECIKGGWSVRELKRQMGSLYFERTTLSTNKEKIAGITHADAEKVSGRLEIRDPYIFEFLGLKPVEVFSERNLESNLIDRLQDFLLELGHGFCFEARQKKILIG